jgi:hypothetical protein
MSLENQKHAIDPAEPVLSPDFSARVIGRMRAERRRRTNRRRASLAMACAFAAALAIYLAAGAPTPALQSPDPTQAANELATEQQAWPFDAAANQTVGGYFFPDFGAMTGYESDYQGSAGVSLDTMLGFDQDTAVVMDVSGS